MKKTKTTEETTTMKKTKTKNR